MEQWLTTWTPPSSPPTPRLAPLPWAGRARLPDHSHSRLRVRYRRQPRRALYPVPPHHLTATTPQRDDGITTSQEDGNDPGRQRRRWRRPGPAVRRPAAGGPVAVVGLYQRRRERRLRGGAVQPAQPVLDRRPARRLPHSRMVRGIRALL